jgi:predicted TPR repeat methyltransferase
MGEEAGDSYSTYLSENYDNLARENEWYGNELCFGLMYEFLEPGQALLDMGIGPGIGSRLYKQAGMTIHGLDIREDMLAECKRKGVADVLRRHDLNERLPYGDSTFDHVISIGVFHFFAGLEHLMSEANRVLKPGGRMAFTVGYAEPGIDGPRSQVVTGHTIFDHPDDYVLALADGLGLVELKRARFSGYADVSKSVLHTSRVFVFGKPEQGPEQRARGQP